MLQQVARVLIANLGMLFFWILFAGLLIAFVSGRPQSSRPSTSWRSRSWPTWGASGEPTWIAKPLEDAREPVRPDASRRKLILALVGAGLLLFGAIARISVMWFAVLYPGADLIYVACAGLSAFYALRKRFRVLYVTGGVALGFLLVSGYVNMLWEQVIPQAAGMVHSRMGNGWPWTIMVAGAILTLFAASLGPGSRRVSAPPPSVPGAP